MASEPGQPLRVRRALLSVDDKTGLKEFARGLADLGVELWATAGTRAYLERAGVTCRPAEEITGVGSWFGGRVKTLHPGLIGGILAPRSSEGVREMAERGIAPIDLVATNFYPFEKYLAEHPDASDREEYVDIGGVTLARAAAKNHAAVVVLVDPGDYPPLLEEMRASGGASSAATRARLAARAFERVAAYDTTIATRLIAGGPTEPFPSLILLVREGVRLRYGENPHQRAALYTDGAGFAPRPFEVRKGDAPSYTNLLDLDTALALVAEFPEPAAAVVKHATPCGVAEGTSVREALDRAIATDPVARFGCAVAVNRPIAAEDLGAFRGVFVDLLAAPEFAPRVLEAVARRTKLKLLRTAPPALERPRWDAKSAFGRVLLQEADRRELAPGDFHLVTKKAATPEERCALDFAWRVVRHAKSNAIVLADGSRTVGIGSGQPTRVKAVQLAVEVAGPRARGAVLASDAFFPFADGVEAAGRAGVTALLQPGGSVRDPQVIAAADAAGMAMYFTGWRVFRH